MTLSVDTLTIDCHDPRVVADFWCAALGYRLDEIDDEGAVVKPAGGPGWTQRGTRWTFKDRNGTLAGGIKKVVLRDLSSTAPGLFKVKVIGKDAAFQVPAGSEPVQLELVLGGPAERVAGQCATRAFNADGGPSPSCEVVSGGNLLKCK